MPGPGPGFTPLLSNPPLWLKLLGGGAVSLRVRFPFPFYYFQIGPLPPLGNCASLSSTLLSGDEVPGTVLMQGHGDEGDTGPPSGAEPCAKGHACRAGQVTVGAGGPRMPWGLKKGSQRRQRPSDGGEGERGRQRHWKRDVHYVFT